MPTLKDKIPEKQKRLIELRNKAKSVKGSIAKKADAIEPENKPVWDHVVSTGSTLVDLAISGTRREFGGIPGGIMFLMYGPSSSGKTALLTEMIGNVQANGGGCKILDPESRLDKEYAQIYGASISEDKNYHKPNTVSEAYKEYIYKWSQLGFPEDKLSIIAADSISALSTDLEMGNEDGDKMGMRRAKEFSSSCRKAARIISGKNRLLTYTSQIRIDKDAYGKEVIPGGMAIVFYASLIGRTAMISRIERETTIMRKIKGPKGKEEMKKLELSKVIGIKSSFYISKSSVDIPFRSAPFYITFGVGIDDVRGNLQFCKDMQCLNSYDCIKTSRIGMEQSITYIEENNLESDLRAKTIMLWREINEKQGMKRKVKQRIIL